VRRFDAEQPLCTPRRYAEFSVSDSGFRGRDPALGEHSREILRELGCTPEEIDALIAAGHCRQAPPAGG
jgi:crotonobetainyl-CoA:carnitine CoA-transferase CaiB-like acyl-CoA transferase